MARSPNGTSDSAGRRLDQAPRQVELDRRLDRHVEQQQRQPAKALGRFRRGLEQRRAIGRRRGRELLLESLEQRGEIGAAERQRAERIGADAGQRQLVQRPRQRARKAGRAGDRPKYESSPSCAASNVARAATASEPIRVTGARHAPPAPAPPGAPRAGPAEAVEADRPAARAARPRGRSRRPRRATRRRSPPRARVRASRRVRSEPERGLGGFDDAKRGGKCHCAAPAPDAVPGYRAPAPRE